MAAPSIGAAPEPEAVLGRLMLAFDGFELPPGMAARLAAAPAAGVSLFRYQNVVSPDQVRELTASLRRAAGRDDLLVGADQEGGQLLGLGEGTTPFPGNMALGAAGDPGLAERVGRAIGLECLALGVNVVYAPSCDLASNPANPGLGIRSFGSDPARVGELAAAFVRGVRSSGAAATVKHFPGLGAVAVDTHLALAAVEGEPDVTPFVPAIDAGAELVMSAHVALPAVTGDPTLPGTLSRAVMHGLLRERLGFRGLAITDALDMAALPQGPEQAIDAIAALAAGNDLLLLTPNVAERRIRIEAALVHAARRGLLAPGDLAAADRRIAALRARLATVARPDLGVVACADHLALAREVAERSLTLLRDDAGMLPLRPGTEEVILAVMPRPVPLTPADTSGSVEAGLGAALRTRHGRVEEIVTGHAPSPGEIAAAVDRAAGAAVIVVGTTAASFEPAQAALVRALLTAGPPVVTVALRTPWELAAYPEARAHVATYGLLRPQLDALATALWGDIPFRGRLPVAAA